ncbi:conserved hypothetical protein [Noviherbaspirillum humi]|uniref:EthD domain-containing protein n=1 Tax=Noviherbaspirillum humi TaxID=1688639 RepID=A0A239F6C5_9BURK|nr:EthD family reductase [Noviherbaspirillum humi]SNS52347.1 conserved hypothetical protein [Noviherbaspirillum humi]
MATLLVLYRQPQDQAAFLSYYFATHVPLAKRIPGLRNYEVSDGPVAPVAGEAAFLVATLSFDSLAAIQEALGSDAGRAAAADLANFATGGAELMMYDTRSV